MSIQQTKSIKIGKYEFAGPFSSLDNIEDRSGVYAVLDQVGTQYYLIDVGESATVKTRLSNHDRKNCWFSNRKGILVYAVYYTSNLQQSGRMLIEQEIRQQYKLPCGQR